MAQYQKATGKRDEALTRVESERAALDEAAAGGDPLPFWRDPLFWAGIGGGALLAVGFGIAATANPESPLLRYLMLLDAPAFGWSGWVALRWIGALEGHERRTRRRRVVEDWAQKIEAQYAKDTSEVQAAIKAAGLQNVGELKEAVGRLADAEAVVAEWRRRLTDWEATPEASGARTEKARLEEERVALEARMGEEVGGFVRDTRSIESEIQRLEAEEKHASARRKQLARELEWAPLRGRAGRARA